MIAPQAAVRAPQISGTLSELTEAIIHLRGKPFTFKGYEFFRQVYDSSCTSKLLKCARQVAKSTYVGNNIAVTGAAIPHFTSLYVAPTENQVTTFNKQKLDPTILYSPEFKKIWFSPANKVTNQATYKKFRNGSDIIMRSCFLSADSIRGISADQVALDEIQDILTDNIPVIRECMTRSKYKYMLMTGTPKTNQHAIEFYWGKSTQFEWLIKCVSCNMWNLLGEENVRYKGLSCCKCSGFLDRSRGQWVQTNLTGNPLIEGYRIPQLMVDWIPWSGAEGSIWDKYTTYSREKFYNEVLALPYDANSCPITLEELKDACDPNLSMVKHRQDRTALLSMRLAAGVDWGTSQEGGSYTVLNIGGFTGAGRFVIVFSKRYHGQEAEPEYQIADIRRILSDFSIDVIGLDWGMGFGMNSRLKGWFGDNRVHEFYSSDNQRNPMQWDNKGERWTLARTIMMTDLFRALKTKNIVLPKWEHIKDFAQDALHIFATEVTRGGSIVKRYDHIPMKPDDWFHSLMYCYLAAIVDKETG